MEKRKGNLVNLKHVVVDPAKLTSTPRVDGKWPLNP
jgi:hypothetical protein